MRVASPYPDPVSAGKRGVDASVIRRAARRFATGVALAGARDGDDVHLITVTAFASLSLDPPLIMVALDRDGRLIDLARNAGHIAVSVLAEEHEHLAEWGARHDRPLRLPEGLRTMTAETGAPLVEDALAWFDCTLESAREHGDHTVAVGRVVACDARSGRPLLYWDRAYRVVHPGVVAPGPPVDDDEPVEE